MNRIISIQLINDIESRLKKFFNSLKLEKHNLGKKIIYFLILIFLVFFSIHDPIPINLALLAIYAGFLGIITESRIAPPIYRFTYEENSRLPEIRLKVDRLLAMATQDIKIVAGKLNKRVYGYPKIEDTISKCLNLGIVIEVVLDGGEIDSGSEKMQQWIQEKKIKLYPLSHHKVSNHFIVIDGQHVRVEDPHEDEETRKSRYWYVSKRLGEDAVKKFEELKKISKAEQLEEI